MQFHCVLLLEIHPCAIGLRIKYFAFLITIPASKHTGTTPGQTGVWWFPWNRLMDATAELKTKDLLSLDDVQNDMTAERQLFFNGAWLGVSQLRSERMGLGSYFTCSSVEQWDSVDVWMAGDSISKSCNNKSESFTRNQRSIVFMFATDIHRQLPCARYMNRSVSPAAPF